MKDNGLPFSTWSATSGLFLFPVNKWNISLGAAEHKTAQVINVVSIFDV